MTALRVLGISGSLRRGSYNTALLRSAAEIMAPEMSLDPGAIEEVPLYNRDVEVEGFPPPVLRLRKQLAAADGLLVACPEYNWSITGALKNAIDWLSRNPASPLDHKPAAIIGGGGRGGGARAQSHLRDVLAHNRVQVYEESEVVVPRVWTAFDDDLKLIDDRVRSDLEVLCRGFAADLRRDLAHRPAVVLVASDTAVVATAYRALIADYRVAPAFDAGDVIRQRKRWSPVVAAVHVDAAAEVTGIPVVRFDDVSGVAAAVEQALT